MNKYLYIHDYFRSWLNELASLLVVKELRRWTTPYFFLVGLILISYLKPAITPKIMKRTLSTIIILSSLIFTLRMIHLTSFSRPNNDASLPNQAIAASLTQLWYQHYQRPLPYIAGSNCLVALTLPYCHSEEEKKLIGIYADEISHLEKGGNLAVGSDILRWLKPVYELGTYTDFDVHVDTRKLPETIFVEKPLLLSVGSYAVKGDVETIVINNDIITVVDSQGALSEIQKIQKLIYACCSKQSSYEENFIEQFISTSRNKLSDLFSPFLAKMLLNPDPNSKVLLLLAHLSKGKTAREVREEIIDVTANNLCFSKSFLRDNGMLHFGLADHQIITKVTSLQRTAIKQQFGWLTWLLLPKAQYKQIEALAAIKDDNEFLTRIREQTRMTILKSNFVCNSGPEMLLYALFDKLFYKKDTVNKEIAPFSFACYGLDKAFISENSISLHANAKTATAKMQNTEVGKSNDLSWLQEGQNATAIREQKIIEAQSHIPQYFHDMREKVEIHIKKIQADLEEVTRFYAIGIYTSPYKPYRIRRVGRKLET